MNLILKNYLTEFLSFFKKQNIFFFRFFSIKVKYSLFRIVFSQKLLFWGYSKWQQIKQNASGLNKSLPLHFWRLRIANYIKFTEECVMYTEKHVLVKQYFWVERTYHRVETQCLVKKKFWAQWSAMKVTPTVFFWDMKRPITTDSLAKGSNVLPLC